MKLPNRKKAIVDIRKLEEYCLNQLHPRGKHKAKVFKTVLGLTRKDANFLKQKLLQAAMSQEAIEANTDIYGKRYYIDFQIIKENKIALIRSIWLVKPKDKIPGFITCYIK